MGDTDNLMSGSTEDGTLREKNVVKGIRVPEAPDKAAWRRSAALADWLGFASTEIPSLKGWDKSDVNIPSEHAQPSLVTAEPGELDQRTSGRPFLT